MSENVQKGKKYPLTIKMKDDDDTVDYKLKFKPEHRLAFLKKEIEKTKVTYDKQILTMTDTMDSNHKSLAADGVVPCA